MSSGSLVQSQSPRRDATSATCASQRSAVPTRTQSSPTSRARDRTGRRRSTRGPARAALGTRRRAKPARAPCSGRAVTARSQRPPAGEPTSRGRFARGRSTRRRRARTRSSAAWPGQLAGGRESLVVRDLAVLSLPRSDDGDEPLRAELPLGRVSEPGGRRLLARRLAHGPGELGIERHREARDGHTRISRGAARGAKEEREW